MYIFYYLKKSMLKLNRNLLFVYNITGKIRGRAHADSCNLRLKEANFVPILFQVSYYYCKIVFAYRSYT